MTYRPLFRYAALGASGILFFLYTTLLAVAASLLAGGSQSAIITISRIDAATIGGTGLIFGAAFMLFAERRLRKNPGTFAPRRRQLPFFLIDTILLFSAFAAVSMLLSAGGALSLPALLSALLVIAFGASFPFFGLASIFITTITFRFFFGAAADSIRSPFFRMESTDTVYLEAEALVNYCKRLDLQLGLIALRCDSYPVISRKHGESALFSARRQFAFLLANSSRNYEPWCYDERMNLYFTFIQCGTHVDFERAVDRYRRILAASELVISNTTMLPAISIGHALFGQSDLSFQVYENAERDFLEGAVRSISESMSPLAREA